ncbi:MAG: iron-sulfur cluster-binding protein [candidate division Zixibacteria bacterium RBG_16_50_21]|nr:MAG: iron-sulfur cluster-binding protein [candidate division Zixibacteria bacterium RBG_16_50_21]
MTSKVVVLKTSPQTVISDYSKLLRLAEYQKHIFKNQDTIIKLNLSWTLYYPACSSQPWQLEGVVKTLLEDGFRRDKLFPLENKTVVTEPVEGAQNNLWSPILRHYGLSFTPLPEVEWVKYQFKSKLLKLNEIFPEGIEIPKMYVGKQIIHLPTVKTHGHAITTGAIKNSFGGLLKEVRHYAHKYMHEVLVDLMLMQKELHPGIFAVMDGTVCGDGAGPRTMRPVIQNYILASADQVAIDSIAAKLMGFNPLEIPYLRMCEERGLGTANPKDIEIVGENIEGVNFGFKVRKSFVIWGDQMLRIGPLRFLERVALHSPLVGWAPFASNFYHDWLWYPTIGKMHIKQFKKTTWGKLFETYRPQTGGAVSCEKAEVLS